MILTGASMRARARKPIDKPAAPPRAAAPSRAAPKVAAPSKAKAEKPEVGIFVSYSHRDADARARLETHLAPLKRDGVTTWFDGDLNAGDKLDTEIARALRNAHVFVGLLSPDYLASNYCWKIEYRRAMNRRANGTMHVVAVVVRPCDWKSTSAAGFKLLPEDGREVTRWRSADDAYLNVAQGIRRVVATVRKELVSKAIKATPRKPAAAPKAVSAPARKPASSLPPKRVAKGTATARPSSTKPPSPRRRP
ncbi:toll/interleukin-1 receptor domain-containing protein [Methylobacterium sp. WL69]|uniref:toll/interleukin-1 receptor domain-containing protein n=1 Tax=Methylobacterium sp. WL69 TaxID=2603893 RepID=UPI001FED61F7|nr:toll/interleukin-1 receptor domain-containing protein [Methylobacterium sp. WL69]